MMHHLARDLERLKAELLSMGGMVEELTGLAVRSVVERRVDLAREVIDADDRVDDRELALEDHCLKMLALHQPVAVDLRFIITCLKVNNDLERMGDLAVNIAERARYLARHTPLATPLDLTAMADKVRGMVRDSLDALVRQDMTLARDVLARDDEVDEANRSMFDILQGVMTADPSTVKRAIALLSSSRYLERLADHATNIAEDVIFMGEGEIIRHQTERFLA